MKFILPICVYVYDGHVTYGPVGRNWYGTLSLGNTILPAKKLDLYTNVTD
jgi:hypothetical protein